MTIAKAPQTSRMAALSTVSRLPRFVLNEQWSNGHVFDQDHRLRDQGNPCSQGYNSPSEYCALRGTAGGLAFRERSGTWELAWREVA